MKPKAALVWFFALVFTGLVWWAAGVATRYVHRSDRPYQFGQE